MDMFSYLRKLVLSEFLIVLILGLTPVFSLLIKGWASSCLFAILAISLIGLISNNFSLTLLFIKNLYKEKSLFYLIILPLLIPTIVVFLTNISKGHFDNASLDGPSRYFFALIILIYLIKNKIQFQKNLFFGILLMPPITLLLIDFVEKKAWSDDTERLTVYFIDPIIFGSICLTFSFLSLVIFFSKNKSILVTVLSLLGFVCGIYLSILSESRTGWLSIPFVFYVLLRYLGGLNPLKTFLLTIIIVITASLFLSNFSNIVKNRINDTVQNLYDYKWNEVNENTSVGERISYIRIGWYFMKLRPLTGWNGLDYLVHKDDAPVAKHALPKTVVGVKGGGFHNEYINNGVKYGFFGMLFSLCLVICPAIFFTKKLYLNNKNIPAILGLTLSIMYFFSCLTYQVLDFKFTISLYSIMLISLVVSTLQNEKTESIFVSKA